MNTKGMTFFKDGLVPVLIRNGKFIDKLLWAVGRYGFIFIAQQILF